MMQKSTQNFISNSRNLLLISSTRITPTGSGPFKRGWKGNFESPTFYGHISNIRGSMRNGLCALRWGGGSELLCSWPQDWSLLEWIGVATGGCWGVYEWCQWQNNQQTKWGFWRAVETVLTILMICLLLKGRKEGGALFWCITFFVARGWPPSIYKCHPISISTPWHDMSLISVVIVSTGPGLFTRILRGTGYAHRRN